MRGHKYFLALTNIFLCNTRWLCGGCEGRGVTVLQSPVCLRPPDRAPGASCPPTEPSPAHWSPHQRRPWTQTLTIKWVSEKKTGQTHGWVQPLNDNRELLSSRQSKHCVTVRYEQRRFCGKLIQPPGFDGLQPLRNSGLQLPRTGSFLAKNVGDIINFQPKYQNTH